MKKKKKMWTKDVYYYDDKTLDHYSILRRHHCCHCCCVCVWLVSNPKAEFLSSSSVLLNHQLHQTDWYCYFLTLTSNQKTFSFDVYTVTSNIAEVHLDWMCSVVASHYDGFRLTVQEEHVWRSVTFHAILSIHRSDLLQYPSQNHRANKHQHSDRINIALLVHWKEQSNQNYGWSREWRRSALSLCDLWDCWGRQHKFNVSK